MSLVSPNVDNDLAEVSYPALETLDLTLLGAGVPFLVGFPARLLLPAPGVPRLAGPTQH